MPTQTPASAPLAPPAPAPNVLPLKKRLHLLQLLEHEYSRLDGEAQRLDREHQARYPADRVIGPDNEAEYEASADKAYAADDAAQTVAELRDLFDRDRLIVALAPLLEDNPVTAITRALVASWSAGHDAGETLALAVADAQRIVHTAAEEWLTSNRPGSWEAHLLEAVIESSGWDQT